MTSQGSQYCSSKLYFVLILTILVIVLYFQNFVTLDGNLISIFKISPIFAIGKPYVNLTDDENEVEYDNETKYILDWTTFFGTPMTNEKQWLGQCPDYKCKIIADKSMLNKSHAVIFHMRNIDWNYLPPVRLPYQYYAFYLMESPAHSHIDSTHADRFFNVTISYRVNSDFFSPYGDFRKISDGNSSKILTNLTNLTRNKTKLVAWFVSNCGTQSRREAYVQEMQKYIPVDVFGGCGNKHCPKTMSCNDMLKYDYKFYLSFENSMCKDYVTEKLFDRMKYFVLPIVLNKTYYEERLPPYSVISASDFDSVKQLVDYLRYLDKNLTAYMEYFEWMKEFTVVNEYGTCAQREKCAFCGLCHFLHKKDKPRKIKYDIHKWWHIDGACDPNVVPRLLHT